VSNKMKKPTKGAQGPAWVAKATDDDDDYALILKERNQTHVVMCSFALQGGGQKSVYVSVVAVRSNPNPQPSCIFVPEGGVGLAPKSGCLLTLAYYAFPR
jgi:hypothetical protein